MKRVRRIYIDRVASDEIGDHSEGSLPGVSLLQPFLEGEIRKRERDLAERDPW